MAKAASAIGVAILGYAAVQWLGRTAGATRIERQAALPGDDMVERPNLVTTHAATFDAEPSRVWPWLVQMGWHQGGWYTARWVDRLLFPANWPAADEIIPELQQRKVGDFVPDGPPESERGFVIERLDPGRCLVLHSKTHLPPSWRRRLGARLEWTWAFVLVSENQGQTRLLFRSRGRAEPGWVRLLYELAIVPADFVMSRQMMAGLRRRVLRRESAVPPAERTMATVGLVMSKGG